MILPCACGCETPITTPDPSGRRRIYIHGHNARVQPSPRQDAVLRALASGPADLATLWQRMGGWRGPVPELIRAACNALKRKGMVEKTSGVWRRAEEIQPS